MTTETLNSVLAIGTAATALFTAASAVFICLAWIAARGQLSEVAKASQLQNFIALGQEAEARDFDDAFRHVLDLRNLTPAIHRTREAQRKVGLLDERIDRVTNYFERIGFLVKNGYLDRTLAITWWGVLAKDAYDALSWLIEQEQEWDPGLGSEFRDFVAASEQHWLECGRAPLGRRRG